MASDAPSLYSIFDCSVVHTANWTVSREERGEGSRKKREEEDLASIWIEYSGFFGFCFCASELA
jgi:hypothetical protein